MVVKIIPEGGAERSTGSTKSATVRNANRNSFEVVVNWKKGFHPRGWDMFGTDQKRPMRMFARVPVEARFNDGRLKVTVTVTDEKGQKKDYVLKHARVEEFHGQHYLHLQANTQRNPNLREQNRTAVFTVKRVKEYK